MSELQPIITPADLEEDRAGQPQLCPIPAGWPSPAENYVEDTLDLHRLVVRNPPATFFCGSWAIPCLGPAFIMVICWW
ncbi:hypothetical protein FACS189460_0350 [Deltaproteobacteria bacterium]|nr:hypothetical protein FACS189460_0350 [Deltaproteobacteria bacterium]